MDQHHRDINIQTSKISPREEKLRRRFNERSNMAFDEIWANLDPLFRAVLVSQRLRTHIANNLPSSSLETESSSKLPIPPMAIGLILFILATAACGKEENLNNVSPTQIPTIDPAARAAELWETVEELPETEKEVFVIFPEGSGRMPLTIVVDDPNLGFEFEQNQELFTVLDEYIQRLATDSSAFFNYPESLPWIGNVEINYPIQHEILISVSDDATDHVMIMQNEQGETIIRSTISVAGLIAKPISDGAFLQKNFGYGSDNAAETGIRVNLVRKLAYAMIRAHFPYELPLDLSALTPEVEYALAVESVAEGFSVATGYAYNPFIHSPLGDVEDYTEAERLRQSGEEVGLGPGFLHLEMGLYPDYPAPFYIAYKTFFYDWRDDIHRDDPEGPRYRQYVKIGEWRSPVAILSKEFFYDLTEAIAQAFPMRSSPN
jgi:hypothetical protein